MRCRAKTIEGNPCGAFAVHGSPFCFTHDPAHAAERARAHKMGGRHRRRGASDAPFPDADVRSASGLLIFVEGLMRETWQLENSVARNRALAYMAQVQKGVLEVGELEERLATLERQVKSRR